MGRCMAIWLEILAPRTSSASGQHLVEARIDDSAAGCLHCLGAALDRDGLDLWLLDVPADSAKRT